MCRSAIVWCSNPGRFRLVVVQGRLWRLRPQASPAPNTSASRPRVSPSYDRRVAAIRTCTLSAIERTGGPLVWLTSIANSRVGAAARRSGSTRFTEKLRSGAEPASGPPATEIDASILLARREVGHARIDRVPQFRVDPGGSLRRRGSIPVVTGLALIRALVPLPDSRGVRRCVRADIRLAYVDLSHRPSFAPPALPPRRSPACGCP